MTGRTKHLVLALLALAAILLLFAACMTRPVTYDEDQYLAAGYFARHLVPYRDFAYLQPPLYPYVLAALFTLADGWFLLAARGLTFVLALGAGALLWTLLRRLGAGLALAAVLMAACLASPFLTSTLSNTRNDALPLVLMLAGLWLHQRFVDRAFWGMAAAALLFGLAVEAKLTYLFGPVALGLHALVQPRRRLPPVLLGAALAAAPAAALWWLAAEPFRFGLLDYHLAAPLDWYGRQGMADLLGPDARLHALAEWAVLGGNLTLVVLAAALSLVAMARHRKWKRPGPLLVMLTAGALLLGFVPAPSWAMYYAPVAPLLACCVAHLDRTTIHLANPMRKRVLFGVAGLAAVPVLALALPDVASLARRDAWVGLAAHDRAARVHAALPRGGVVATLFPHAVMDRNPIRADLAAGPFLFRTATLFDAARLERVHALTPAGIGEAFIMNPPAAIYAGAYADAWSTPMDAALARYAQSRNWAAIPVGPGAATLWVRP